MQPPWVVMSPIKELRDGLDAPRRFLRSALSQRLAPNRNCPLSCGDTANEAKVQGPLGSAIRVEGIRCISCWQRTDAFSNTGAAIVEPSKRPKLFSSH